jgi:hypothetical protein
MPFSAPRKDDDLEWAELTSIALSFFLLGYFLGVVTHMVLCGRKW